MTLEIQDTLYLRASDNTVWRLVVNPDGTLTTVNIGTATN